MSTCQGPECERQAKCKGLCLTHYQQMNAGKPLKPIGYYRAQATKALIEQNKAKQNKARSKSGPKPKPKVKCSGPACARSADSKGLCKYHYGQWRTGKPLTPKKIKQVDSFEQRQQDEQRRRDKEAIRERRYREQRSAERPNKPPSTGVYIRTPNGYYGSVINNFTRDGKRYATVQFTNRKQIRTYELEVTS